MAASSSVELSLLPPPRGDVLVDGTLMRAANRPDPAHEPAWLPVLMALVLVVCAVNWRRGKPGLIGAVLRQIRR